MTTTTLTFEELDAILALIEFHDDWDECSEQQSVINSVVGNTYEVEVDDDNDDEQIAQALVEEVTDLTGWCVCSLDFVHVLNTY